MMGRDWLGNTLVDSSGKYFIVA